MKKEEFFRQVTCHRCKAVAFILNRKKWYRIICTECGLIHWFRLNKKQKDKKNEIQTKR